MASNGQVDSLLREAGLNMERLKADAQSHGAEIDALLRRNDTEARALGIRGTPGLLVGRHIINGVYDVPGLKQAVATARFKSRPGRVVVVPPHCGGRKVSMNFRGELAHRKPVIRNCLLGFRRCGFPRHLAVAQRLGYRRNRERIDEFLQRVRIESGAFGCCRQPRGSEQEYPSGQRRHYLIAFLNVEGEDDPSGSPVVSFRTNTLLLGGLVKFSIPAIELAMLSNEPEPMR